MIDLKKSIKRAVDFEENTKQGKKSDKILIDTKDKDIPVKVITKRSL